MVNKINLNHANSAFKTPLHDIAQQNSSTTKTWRLVFLRSKSQMVAYDKS